MMAAERLVQAAFRTDVTPLIAEVRLQKGGAIDPVEVFRRSGYRQAVADQRGKAPSKGTTI